LFKSEKLVEDGHTDSESTLKCNHHQFNYVLPTDALMWPNSAFSSSGWIRSFKNSQWSRIHV